MYAGIIMFGALFEVKVHTSPNSQWVGKYYEKFCLFYEASKPRIKIFHGLGNKPGTKLSEKEVVKTPSVSRQTIRGICKVSEQGTTWEYLTFSNALYKKARTKNSLWSKSQ